MRDILFIEDDKDLQNSFKIYFEAKGFKIRCMSRGEDGIKCAAEDKPDMIVLDMLLPGMDGAEVCRRIKNDQRTNKIPVIVYTAVRTAMGIDITKYDYKWIPADKVVDKCDGYDCLYKAILSYC